MTTICYRAPHIAGDSLAWEENTCVGTMQKCGQMADGSLWGFAGSVGALSRVRLWLDYPMGDPPELDEHTTIMIVQRSGLVRIWEKEGWVDLEAPFHAAGTGSDIARGAMAFGATAEQAVKIACDFDAFTGGAVGVFTLPAADDDEDIPDMTSEALNDPPEGWLGRAPNEPPETWRRKIGLE